MSLPSLHRHALQSVFSFCALPALSRLSAVCREWQSVAFSMPSLQLCRLATKLGTAQLDEVMAVLQQRKLLREANGAHKELVLQQLRRTLDKEQCLVVGAPLLSLLESAEVTRKHMYHGDSHDTRIRLRLPLSVLPRGIASLTTPVAPISTELQLAWEVAEGYESENTWSILWHTTGPPVSLLRCSEFICSGGDTEVNESMVHPFAGWLRERGFLAGDARQQYTLLSQAVSTLFRLADESSRIGEECYADSCAAVCGYTIQRRGFQQLSSAAAAAPTGDTDSDEGDSDAE